MSPDFSNNPLREEILAGVFLPVENRENLPLFVSQCCFSGYVECNITHYHGFSPVICVACPVCGEKMALENYYNLHPDSPFCQRNETVNLNLEETKSLEELYPDKSGLEALLESIGAIEKDRLLMGKPEPPEDLKDFGPQTKTGYKEYLRDFDDNTDGLVYGLKYLKAEEEEEKRASLERSISFDWGWGNGNPKYEMNSSGLIEPEPDLKQGRGRPGARSRGRERVVFNSTLGNYELESDSSQKYGYSNLSGPEIMGYLNEMQKGTTTLKKQCKHKRYEDVDCYFCEEYRLKKAAAADNKPEA